MQDIGPLVTLPLFLMLLMYVTVVLFSYLSLSMGQYQPSSPSFLDLRTNPKIAEPVRARLASKRCVDHKAGSCSYSNDGECFCMTDLFHAGVISLCTSTFFVDMENILWGVLLSTHTTQTVGWPCHVMVAVGVNCLPQCDTLSACQKCWLTFHTGSGDASCSKTLEFVWMLGITWARLLQRRPSGIDRDVLSQIVQIKYAIKLELIMIVATFLYLFKWPCYLCYT